MSTLDLFHLALTCSEYYRVIRTPDEIFHRLKRLALCDGRGLIERQEFKRLHAPSGSDHWSGNRTAVYDEELEVQVWNRKCDAANALPCLRCQVNVCEVSSSSHVFPETKLRNLMYRNVDLFPASGILHTMVLAGDHTWKAPTAAITSSAIAQLVILALREIYLFVSRSIVTAISTQGGYAHLVRSRKMDH